MDTTSYYRVQVSTKGRWKHDSSWKSQERASEVAAEISRQGAGKRVRVEQGNDVLETWEDGEEIEETPGK